MERKKLDMRIDIITDAIDGMTLHEAETIFDQIIVSIKETMKIRCDQTQKRMARLE